MNLQKYGIYHRPYYQWIIWRNIASESAVWAVSPESKRLIEASLAKSRSTEKDKHCVRECKIINYHQEEE